MPGKQTTQTQALLEALFDAAPDAILVVDGAGVVRRMNDQAVKMFGHTREQAVGQPVEVFIPERFHHRHTQHRAGYVAEPRTRLMGEGLDLAGRRRDGSEFPVEIALAHIATDRGPLVLSIIRDVTRRRTIEQALRDSERQLAAKVEERTAELRDANHRLIEERAKLIQAEKLSSIGLLASGVAHEINNPLSGVMGLVKALERGDMADEERNEFFKAVQDGLERMRFTVQGLLNFSRQESTSRETLGVSEICSACVQLVAPAARKKGVQTNIAVPDDVTVFGDRSQLMQAILNVIMNAIHASPEGGTIDVSIATASGRTGIRVTDRGPGIPEDIRNRVCDPFFTTKPEGEGTGLGLAITLNILRAHRGDLSIEDGANGGTAVTLWLPDDPGAGDA